MIENYKNIKKLILLSICCLLFMFVELMGSILCNSLTILLDASNFLVNGIAFLINAISLYVYEKKQMEHSQHFGSILSMFMIYMDYDHHIYIRIHSSN